MLFLLWSTYGVSCKQILNVDIIFILCYSLKSKPSFFSIDKYQRLKFKSSFNCHDNVDQIIVEIKFDWIV